MPFEIRLEEEPLPSDHPCRLASIGLKADAPEGTIKTNLMPLQKIQPFENWYAEQPVHPGERGKLSYAFNDAVLFGHAKLNQKHIVRDLQEIYKDMVQLLNSERYSLLRVWHYLPQLAEPSDYRVFCDARAQAFSLRKEDSYCAATAIGTGSNCGVIYFIAARKAGVVVNNPRQTLPHLYPKRYVEPPPMFARATLKQWGDKCHLYISGTAAIVGHTSLHDGDADAQLSEVVNNLNSLLNEAAKTEPSYSKIPLSRLRHIKLYMDKRVSEDVATLIDSHLGSNIGLQVFEGQMCRPELLVEIEAMAISDPMDE